MTETKRRFVPPLGWPPRFRAVRCYAAERPRLIALNRYPRQIVGIALRVPHGRKPTCWSLQPGHPYLSVLWARPARWWVE